MGGEGHVPWFEKVLGDAVAAGEFDGLSGSGKAIEDLDRVYEPAWWAKRFIERERLNDAAVALATRMRRELPSVLAERDEGAVEQRLQSYREEIDAINTSLSEHEKLPPLDVEQMLADRRRRQKP